MTERTSDQITRSLFSKSASAEDRIDVLAGLVLDLMVEVEALRSAREESGDKDTYRESYRRAALLSHNSAGTTGGWQKTLERFYPSRMGPDGRVWRESIMLRRLGSSDEQVKEFTRKASEAELYT